MSSKTPQKYDVGFIAGLINALPLMMILPFVWTFPLFVIPTLSKAKWLINLRIQLIENGSIPITTELIPFLALISLFLIVILSICIFVVLQAFSGNLESSVRIPWNSLTA